MEKVPDTHHLTCRQGVWYYRRRVPEDVRKAIGKAVIQFSLGTSKKAEAKKLREAHDLRWSATFDHARRNTTQDKPDQTVLTPPSGHTLTEALATHLVRDYVERMDRRFQHRQAVDGPESEAQRQEMQADIQEGIQILRNLDDPRGAEWVYDIQQKILKHSGATLDSTELLPGTFEHLVRRGLLEVDFRKLSRLADDYSRRSFDTLFDPAAPPLLTFGELAHQFMQLREEDASANAISAKSIDRTRAQVGLVRQLVGDGTPISEIDYDTCLRVRSLLARVPANLTKFYNGLPLAEAIARAEGDRRESLAPITQQQYLAVFSDLLSLAAKKRLISVNPAEGLSPVQRDDRPRAEKRLPFTLEQIRTFFHGPFYERCAASGPEPYKYDTAGGWRFWLPLLCLFMGLRPREACQMHTADLRQTSNGTWYIDITATDDEDTIARKTIKTASSKRQVPVHPELLRLGFVQFVRSRNGTSANPRLFPLKENKYGDPAQYPLKRFNEVFLKEAILVRERQAFYSFRHSFRDALKRVGASPDVLDALGWSQGGRVVSDHYGSRLDPDQLFEPIRSITFPGLDLSHLNEKESE